MIFDGFIAENYRRTGLLDPALPFFSLGADRALVRRWRECLYLARSSRRGRSQMLSQALFALLGHVFAEGRRTAAGDSGDSPRDAVARVIEVMESRLEAPAFDLAAAAAALHVGHSTLRRRFREATGLSAARYFAEMKMQAARARLLNTDAPVKVIAAALGFADPYHFSRRFKQLAGVSPQHFRRGFRGESPAPASE
jgi:transcriptional regulator GlxA family with amidase domain